MASPGDRPYADALVGSRSLVIGGTSGIGFAIATGAVAAHGHVYVSSSSSQKVSDAVVRLKALYPGANGIVDGSASDLSVSNTLEASILALLDKAIEVMGGPLDHIVITAARAPVGEPMLTEITTASLDGSQEREFRVKLPMMIAKFVAKFPGKYLARSPRSSITLTSGVLARKPFPGMSPLWASSGSSSLCLSLAIDLAPIRVNVVLPGATDTPLLQGAFAAMIDTFKEKSLVKEIGTPWDCAEAYLFLMRTRFITGQEIVVDGGLLLQ